MANPAARTWLALPAGAGPQQLLAWLHANRLTPQPNHWVHGVVVTDPAQAQALCTALQPLFTGTPLSGEPHAAPPEWADGLHRLTGPGWTLTFCTGPSHEVAPLLATLTCQAHRVWLGMAQAGPLPPALPKALARLCGHGAQLTLAGVSQPHTATTNAATPHWAQAGFVPAGAPGCDWVYQPRWPLAPQPVWPRPHVVVIGAGLAGAALCASLTARGWRVDLLDQHGGPAQGASGLPVGLLSEHVTAQPTVLSALSRTGMALQLRELHTLVPIGQGWQPTRVSQVPTQLGDPALPAAMVRPSALVQAWLAQAQATGLLHTHWHCQVDRLRQTASPTLGDWQVLNAQGQVLAQAPHVVVAAAHGSAALLAPHMGGMADTPAEQPLRAVKGQMTWGPLTGPPHAPHPMRDSGVYVPCYEDSQHPLLSRLWTMGSTYERGTNNRTTTSEAQARNAQRLQAMCPPAHALLQQQLASGALLNWAEVRCASLDRLPLVGAVPATGPLRPSTQLAALPRVPGLWTLCALGSRGLTLSKLSAELLVARLLGEPWPLEKRHADALDPGRFALKAARSTHPTQPTHPAHPALAARHTPNPPSP